jgi:lipoate-protein ligase B
MHIHLVQLGRLGYAEGLEAQARVVAARKAGAIGDTLLLLEHPPVITLGRNASRANIVASDELLAARGVELHEINRGGDVTYHGPGQLVGYPIFDLRGEWPGKKGPHLGPVDFVRMMEEALIRACADFGVMAKRIPKCTGVWTFGGEPTDAMKPHEWGTLDQEWGTPETQVSEARPGAPAHEWGTRDQESGSLHRESGIPETQVSEARPGAPSPLSAPARKIEKKLAAIGIHVSQAVTSHGFALNVTTDLREFEWIIPCGIIDRGVTSLELEGDPATEPTMERAANAVARNFGRVFGRQMLWCESLDDLLAAGR